MIYKGLGDRCHAAKDGTDEERKPLLPSAGNKHSSCYGNIQSSSEDGRNVDDTSEEDVRVVHNSYGTS